ACHARPLHGFPTRRSSDLLTTQPTVSTTAVKGSPAGTYPVSVTGAVGANYSITYADGTLTVGQASLVLVGNDAAKTYGEANPTLDRKSTRLHASHEGNSYA